jgi:hypothetical protein
VSWEEAPFNMRLRRNHSRPLVQVIEPYWLDDQNAWVFDDPEKGLQREPFVKAASDIISRLACNLQGAKEGFRLFFSDSPFPGFQLHLLQQFPERGGYWYMTADSFRAVWLCPALLRYFAQAPSELYIRAESKASDEHKAGK